MELMARYSLLDKSLLPDDLITRNMYNSRNGIPAEFVANKAIHEVMMKSNLRSNSLNRI